MVFKLESLFFFISSWFVSVLLLYIFVISLIIKMKTDKYNKKILLCLL